MAVVTAVTLFIPQFPALGQQGEALLRRGLDLFNRGELKAAEKALTRAADALAPGKDRAQAYLHLGLTRAYRDRLAAAKRDFVRAISDDPIVTVDRERVPPKVLAAFEEARALVTGVLVVEGAMPGARVEIGGRIRGQLPFRDALSVGEYAVRILDASGNPLHAERVLVRAGEERTVRLAAQPPPPVAPPPRPEAPVSEPPRAEPPAESPKREPPAPKPVAPKPEPPKPEAPAAEPAKPEIPPAEAPAEPPAPAPAMPLAEPSWFTPRRTAGVTALATSVVLGLVSLGFGLSAKGAEDRLREAQGGANEDLVIQLQGDAQSRARLSNVFLGIAAAAAATGIVLVVWPSGAKRPAARLVPTGHGAALALEY